MVSGAPDSPIITEAEPGYLALATIREKSYSNNTKHKKSTPIK